MALARIVLQRTLTDRRVCAAWGPFNISLNGLNPDRIIGGLAMSFATPAGAFGTRLRRRSIARISIETCDSVDRVIARLPRPRQPTSKHDAHRDNHNQEDRKTKPTLPVHCSPPPRPSVEISIAQSWGVAPGVRRVSRGVVLRDVAIIDIAPSRFSPIDRHPEERPGGYWEAYMKSTATFATTWPPTMVMTVRPRPAPHPAHPITRSGPSIELAIANLLQTAKAHSVSTGRLPEHDVEADAFRRQHGLLAAVIADPIQTAFGMAVNTLLQHARGLMPPDKFLEMVERIRAGTSQTDRWAADNQPRH